MACPRERRGRHGWGRGPLPGPVSGCDRAGAWLPDVTTLKQSEGIHAGCSRRAPSGHKKSGKPPMSVQSIDPPAAALPVWRSSWALLLGIAAVGLLSLWPFWDGLHQLWVWWENSPEDNFSMLIPPIAAFLVWQQRDRLERIPFTGSWWGLWVILLGGVLLFLGQLGTIITLVQYAYVITLYGLALSLLGWPAFRIIAAPLLIVLFMIPLPQFFMANLSTALQLWSSRFGVFVMRLLDI